ncbi:pirin family protein [Marinobacter sp.]|uniref:pirin family protein n=1 Tax=Marinobacter sp. TaxID=50741 RepID=UPI00345B8934
MSNLSSQTEFDCPITKECGALVQLLQPRERDLGGFSVRRVLPVVGQKMIGPWIFFDHMGPAHFPAGDGINVRPHPHIGIATVTYLFEGEILHRDSLGSLQPISLMGFLVWRYTPLTTRLVAWSGVRGSTVVPARLNARTPSKAMTAPAINTTTQRRILPGKVKYPEGSTLETAHMAAPKTSVRITGGTFSSSAFNCRSQDTCADDD